MRTLTVVKTDSAHHTMHRLIGRGVLGTLFVVIVLLAVALTLLHYQSANVFADMGQQSLMNSGQMTISGNTSKSQTRNDVTASQKLVRIDQTQPGIQYNNDQS